eukprot:CAMPEP_0203816630 /NCGR_PEP_ID=MMETSP0115-20131106/16952_1 /ASSEMBLY_ACC=CAM_ASM_000227 /TAXON_ID=33651 /ORGANISM="Bicosoecid sp, Strain ms1" /LENGTH=346 /DNA_ID=CAMNT_0050725537 /DNA_START=75 /DNA_END=1111 /DNA_ORIENTATION=+
MGSGASLGASTTADEVADLAAAAETGNVFAEPWTAVVTGANSGIGEESARVLAARGVTVVLACRSLERGNAAADGIRRKHPDARLRVMELDVGHLASVRAFAAALLAALAGDDALPPLKLLMNNAGIMAVPEYRETVDGIEQQWGVNHLGHFLLTELLLPTLRANQPSRIVNLSSSAHAWCKHWDDATVPPTREGYSGTSNYGVSKVSNIFFTRELNRRNVGTGVSAYAVHPGVIYTNLQRQSTGFKVFYAIGRVFMKTIPQGAATQLYCAVLAPPVPECVAGATAEAAAKVANNTYFYSDCKEAHADTTDIAKLPDAPAQVWAVSERCVAEVAAREAGGGEGGAG